MSIGSNQGGENWDVIFCCSIALRQQKAELFRSVVLTGAAVYFNSCFNSRWRRETVNLIKRFTSTTDDAALFLLFPTEEQYQQSSAKIVLAAAEAAEAAVEAAEAEEAEEAEAAEAAEEAEEAEEETAEEAEEKEEE